MNSKASEPSAALGKRVMLRASCGVQGNEGLNFGRLMWIEAGMLYVEVDAEHRATERLALRVDLSPAPGTVLMEGEVVSAIPRSQNNPQAYLVRQRSVSAADGARWNAFLAAKASGGAVRDVAAPRPAEPTPSSPSRGTSSAGFSAGSAGFSAGSRGSFPTMNTVSSLPSASHAGDIGTGRAVMRDALKAAIVRPTDAARPATSAPARPAPADPGPARLSSVSSRADTASGSVSGSASAEWARVHAPPKPTPPPAVTTPRPPPARPAPSGLAAPAPVVPHAPNDPTWLPSTVAGRCYIEVKWRSIEAFSHDVHGQLVSNVLTLLSDGRPVPSTPPIHLVLRYGTMVVQTAATPMRTLPMAVTYRLELDASQLAELRRNAQGGLGR